MPADLVPGEASLVSMSSCGRGREGEREKERLRMLSGVSSSYKDTSRIMGVKSIRFLIQDITKRGMSVYANNQGAMVCVPPKFMLIRQSLHEWS